AGQNTRQPPRRRPRGPVAPGEKTGGMRAMGRPPPLQISPLVMVGMSLVPSEEVTSLGGVSTVTVSEAARVTKVAQVRVVAISRKNACRQPAATTPRTMTQPRAQTRELWAE